MNRKTGFTLIELLVVVAIIALLTGILVPAVGRAREAAHRAACLANLRSIGQAIRDYMSENHDFYPPMATMPTIEVSEDPMRQHPRPAMCNILAEYVGDPGKDPNDPHVPSNPSKVFKCPSDHIINPGVDVPAGIETWYKWQGSSYQPRSTPFPLSVVDNTGRWLLSRENASYAKLEDVVGSVSKIVLVHDYEHFHGKADSPNSTMALFADFHAGAMGD